MTAPPCARSSIATAATLIAGYALAFFYAPLEAEGFIQKIFYLHVPLAIVALVGFVVAAVLAILHLRDERPALGRALLRLDPHVGHLRHRGAADGRALGEGAVGRVVGMAGADPGQLPDRVPALRHLLPAALRGRGPRPPGALRLGLRDHRRRLRPAQLHGGAPCRALHPPAHLLLDRRPAGRDAARLPRLPGGDGAAVGDAGPLRAGRQGRRRRPGAPAPRAGAHRGAGPVSPHRGARRRLRPSRGRRRRAER